MSFADAIQNAKGIQMLSGIKDKKEPQSGTEFSTLLMEENARTASVAHEVKQQSMEAIKVHNNALPQMFVPDPKEEFLDFMNKTPEERMRAQILYAMGLTEEEVEAMTPEDRMKVEQKVAEIIQEKVQQGLVEEVTASKKEGDDISTG